MNTLLLPNFFMVGAPRTGTTSLYNYLAQHPQVYMSPVKEPNYFARSLLTAEFFAYRNKPSVDLNASLDNHVRKTVHLAYVTSWDEYVGLFARAGGKHAVGEASTLYLQCPGAPNEIKAAVPHARIIIGLRQPVERVYSEYLMNYTIGLLRVPIAEAVAREQAQGFPRGGLIAGSFYYEEVRRYLDVFGMRRVMIFLQEDLRDEAAFRRRVCGFLGIEHVAGGGIGHHNGASFSPRSSTLNYLLYQSGLKDLFSRIVPAKLKETGKSYYYKNRSMPRLSGEERRGLFAIFQSDIRKLEPLIGRDLSQWLR